MMDFSDGLQNAILRLCEVSSYKDLERGFRESLQMNFYDKNVCLIIEIPRILILFFLAFQWS